MQNKTPLLRVLENSTIEISFKLLLSDGTIVDETEKDELLKLTIGDGQFISALDQLFIGLEEGTTAKFNLSPFQAYGEENQDNIQTMSKADFPPDMKFNEGSVISFDSPTSEVLGTVYRIDGEKVEVNFNHPLAGKHLRFEFKIVKIILE